MTPGLEQDDREALRLEIERLRGQVRELTERAEKAEELADHDVLTPTLNRRGFMRLVRRLQAYSKRYKVDVVLIYLDMDGFKQINDRFGHAAGDAALIHVSQILLAGVRESDAVGRLGGDEFALALINANHADGVAKAKELMLRLQAQPFQWQDQEIRIQGSFGVKAYDGQPDVETWLDEADSAMWLRKRETR